MPPELQGDVILLRTQAIRVSTNLKVRGALVKGSSSAGGTVPSLRPFAVKEMKLGPITRSAAGGELPFNLSALFQQYGIQAVGLPAPISLHFEKISARQEYAFRLVNEEERAAPPLGVRCTWVAAATRTVLSGTPVGVEMKVPGPSLVLCELTDAKDPEPWRLSLWVGPPSRLVPPEFPSGGELTRGAVRYEATSTNAAPLGLKSAMILATFFNKEGRAVAAVERNQVPGRVIMQCSTPPAEQPIFVAIGAALYIRDGQALPIEY